MPGQRPMVSELLLGRLRNTSVTVCGRGRLGSLSGNETGGPCRVGLKRFELASEAAMAAHRGAPGDLCHTA